MRVEPGPVKRCSKPHGLGWVESQRVGMPRDGSGNPGPTPWPDPTLET